MTQTLRPLYTGTQVVTLVPVIAPDNTVRRPAGSVGIITREPAGLSHAYRVRFSDGKELSFLRRQLDVRRHHERHATQDDPNWTDFIQYRCVVGSRAFNLNSDTSDYDRRGFFLPPADAHWSLWGVPKHIEDPVTRDTYWELGRFLEFLLKADPNALEALSSPLVEHATPLAEELRALTPAFLSQLVYQTYSGYVMTQLKKLEADVRNHGGPRWKHGMHLLRLLISGTHIVRTGEMLLDVTPWRDQLLDIKRGEWTWEAFAAWHQALQRDFEQAFASTRLPERPLREPVNDYLIRARRSMV